jgi:PAS domain S-box-containing protein
MAKYETMQALGINIEELCAINNIIQEITLNLPKPDFINVVYDTIYSIVKPDLSLIYLVEEGRLRLQGDPLRGAAIKPEIKQYHVLGECLCGSVAETGEAIYAEDLIADPRCTLEECKQAGIRSFAALPLKIKGALNGVLGIASIKRCRFADHSNFLQSIAGHIAIGINSAGLYEEIQQKNNLLKAELSKLKKAELALRESEAKFRLLYEKVPLGYQSLDETGHFLEVNPSWLDMLGYRKEEVVGQWFGDFLHPDDTDFFKVNFPKYMERRDIVRGVEFRLRRKDDAYLLAEYTANFGRDDQDIFVQTHWVFQDITEKRKIEESLLESEKNYCHLVKHAPTAIYEVDTINLKFKSVNDAMSQFLGYTKEELLSMNPLEILSEKSQQVQLKRLRKAHAGEKVSESFERIVKAKNGREYRALFNSRLKYEKGVLIGATVVVHDITARHQSAEALRESEKRYHALADATFEAIFISQNGFCIDANQTAARMFGYRHEDLIGIFGTDVIAPESKEIVKRNMLSDYEAPYEVLAQKKDGSRFHVEIRGRMAKYKGRKVRITVVRDINERKIAEAAIQKNHDELERKVAERTFELAKANQQLKGKADNLKEANIALNVLLKKRENDKTELEERVLLNVKELVMPYLKRLKQSRLDDRQKTLANILESNLNGIISSFLHTLSANYYSLTPKEIRVAGLVRDGHTTKEIAKLLISSTDTIDFHRKNIRKKLGIQNTKSNLRSYLLSLS